MDYITKQKGFFGSLVAGVMAVRFRCYEDNLCFINTKLPTDPKFRLDLCHETFKLQFGGNGDEIHPLAQTFWFGDFGWRVSGGFEENAKDFTQLNTTSLLKRDEFLIFKKDFPLLEKFNEGTIRFLPTYKYERGSKLIDLKKKENPAYPDRIYFSSGTVTCLHYQSFPEYTTSDHKPVRGFYEVQVSTRPSNRFRLSMSPSTKNANTIVVEKPTTIAHWLLDDFIWESNPISYTESYSIHKCTHKISQREYAIKIVPHKKTETDKEMNEMNLMMEMDSPFIGRCYRSFEANDFTAYIMDLFEAGSLYDVLQKGKMSEDEARFYIAQLVLGLKTIHSLFLVHRDIRPENLMFTKNGYIKLVGFHFSKLVLTRTFTKCGTAEYLPPEIILSNGHNRCADYWNLGILTFELLCGYPPFTDQNEVRLFEKILKGTVIFPQFVSQEARDFIKGLLKVDKNYRLGNLKGGIDDIINHPWLKGIDLKLLEKREIRPPFCPEISKTSQSPSNDLIFNGFESTVHFQPQMEFSENEEGTNSPKQVLEKRGKLLYPLQIHDKMLQEGEVVNLVGPESDRLRSSIDNEFSWIMADQFQEIESSDVNSRRKNIIDEFLTTEESYVRNLDLLIQYFMNPLQKLLAPEIHQKIFSSVKMIHGINMMFLKSFENAAFGENRYLEVAKVLTHFAPAFKLYIDYINNFNSSLEALSLEKAKNPRFRQFLFETAKDLANLGVSSDLNSYMILPIQRLPRYRMLCDDLLRNTPVEEYDYMQSTAKSISDIVRYCNEKNREIDTSRYVFQLQKRYGLAIDNTQTLVHEKKVESINVIWNGKDVVPNHLYLFNNMLLMTMGRSSEQFMIFPFENTKIILDPPSTITLTRENTSFAMIFDQLQDFETWKQKIHETLPYTFPTCH